MSVFLQLKELSHDNIKPFIGACVEPRHICYLTQWCNRGTVQVNLLIRTFVNTTDVGLHVTIKFSYGKNKIAYKREEKFAQRHTIHPRYRRIEIYSV